MAGLGGVSHYKVTLRASDSIRFSNFITECVYSQTDYGFPALKPNDILVIDNATTHHSHDAQLLKIWLETQGIDVVYTSKYSPDMNPIEGCFELISKYNVGLKTLLSEGLSEPEFYGDLVYKFKKLIGSNDFSFQFRKIITRYRRIGYNLNVMRQSACLVFNPITVDNYAAFFNCTPVGRASDSMMAPT